VWDAENGQEVLSLKGHGVKMICLAYSPDGGYDRMLWIVG
jgi:hypothetical protein